MTLTLLVILLTEKMRLPMANQLRLVVYPIINRGFIHPRWLFWISSINSIPGLYPIPPGTFELMIVDVCFFSRLLGYVIGGISKGKYIVFPTVLFTRGHFCFGGVTLLVSGCRFQNHSKKHHQLSTYKLGPLQIPMPGPISKGSQTKAHVIPCVYRFCHLLKLLHPLFSRGTRWAPALQVINWVIINPLEWPPKGVTGLIIPRSGVMVPSL